MDTYDPVVIMSLAARFALNLTDFMFRSFICSLQNTSRLQKSSFPILKNMLYRCFSQELTPETSAIILLSFKLDLITEEVKILKRSKWECSFSTLQDILASHHEAGWWGGYAALYFASAPLLALCKNTRCQLVPTDTALVRHTHICCFKQIHSPRKLNSQQKICTTCNEFL